MMEAGTRIHTLKKKKFTWKMEEEHILNSVTRWMVHSHSTDKPLIQSLNLFMDLETHDVKINEKINYYAKIKINAGKDIKKLKIRHQNNFNLGFVNITPLLSIRHSNHSQFYSSFLSTYYANNGK